MTAFDLERTYLFIDGEGGVVPAAVTPDFWRTMGSIPNAGDTLITVSDGKGAWTRWEMHPAGEEILIILEGAPTFWFEHADGRLERTQVAPGGTVIVPKGAWHRAEADAPYKILFITYGAGTTHKPVTDDDRARAKTLMERT